jgi:hypothetical protein
LLLIGRDMRLPSLSSSFSLHAWLIGLAAFASVVACGPAPVDDTTAPGPTSIAATTAPSSPPPSSSAAPKPAHPAVAEDGTLPEVVYVFMRDRHAGLWFCTGTLVSKSIVVTAAHCLDQKEFIRYEIVAPGVANRPRVAASRPAVFGGDYADVANPDFGILVLSRPIDLPAYAELTDVTARVDAGEAIVAAAVVRTAETPEAPLHVSEQLPVSSTVEYGYEHGFGTPMFSNGGDSGAGLFLVENGKPTHKLIGVARQPEPSRNLDHFTRVDPALLAWYATQVSGG